MEIRYPKRRGETGIGIDVFWGHPQRIEPRRSGIGPPPHSRLLLMDGDGSSQLVGICSNLTLAVLKSAWSGSLATLAYPSES